MSTNKENAVAKTNNAPAKVEMSQSERFTNMVMMEFAGNTGNKLELTTFQRKLIQNYFIKLDSTLKDAEKKRMAKKEENRDALSLVWDNVNMQKLAARITRAPNSYRRVIVNFSFIKLT